MFHGIKSDVKAVFDNDPAAKSILEVLFCYPGLHCIMIHRLSHRLYKSKMVFLSRLISQFARWLTGIEIHPGAQIGRRVFIDHGMGVVIGETAEIEDGVVIYQGVTLGGTGKDKGKRHPTIGSNCIIGAGAKVLGPFKVGDNSKIGAGSVVLKEVPPDSTVVGVPGQIVQGGKRKKDCLDHGNLPDPVMAVTKCLEKRLKDIESKVEALKEDKADDN
ncbi:serine O-acetyltransferase [Proteinivorax hydrogeniformans]|uniref:Serine acetyltransferase n=1 Tax=Proteinivorax hydrogeniformans TaxID=1826727 RepID=A0AAU8HTZ1_9FIRM